MIPLPRRLRIYARLMRLDRPVGTMLLLWPTLWALWLAGEGRPDGQLVMIFALGVFLMRSAGCVINDYADRHIDPHVERTRARPLVTADLPLAEVLGLFIVLCLLAFLLVLLTNRLTVLLSFAAVSLAVIYPFMKRHTHWPQLFLGAAFGWAVPMAFAAQTGAVPAAAWLIFAANICWVVTYDTMYAMVDREDDLKIGVKSTAILFGARDRHIIGLFQLTFIGLMVAAGSAFGLSWPYYAGLAGAAVIAIYHQSLIFRRRPEQCFRAFLHNNILGAVVFAGTALSYAEFFSL